MIGGAGASPDPALGEFRQGLEAACAACASGRFVPSVRNRPIGQERVRLTLSAGGGIRLEAETDLALPRFSLRQEVTAEFGSALRPERCEVSARIDSRPMQIAIRIDGDRAAAHYRLDGQDQTREGDLAHAPLLLIDNCFSLHALSALRAGRDDGADRAFTSIPTFRDLTATAPGGSKVLLGGMEFNPPSVTLRLAPHLDEHVWSAGAWVERLVIPQLQIRVDWVQDPKGGRCDGDQVP